MSMSYLPVHTMYVWPIFTKFLKHVIYSCSSVLLWQCCDTLHTSSFVYDVILAHTIRVCQKLTMGVNGEVPRD